MRNRRSQSEKSVCFENLKVDPAKEMKQLRYMRGVVRVERVTEKPWVRLRWAEKERKEALHPPPGDFPNDSIPKEGIRRRLSVRGEKVAPCSQIPLVEGHLDLDLLGDIMLLLHVLHEIPLAKEALAVDTLATSFCAWEWCLVMLLTHMLRELPSGGEEWLSPQLEPIRTRTK